MFEVKVELQVTNTQDNDCIYLFLDKQKSSVLSAISGLFFIYKKKSICEQSSHHRLQGKACLLLMDFRNKEGSEFGYFYVISHHDWIEQSGIIYVNKCLAKQDVS